MSHFSFWTWALGQNTTEGNHSPHPGTRLEIHDLRPDL